MRPLARTEDLIIKELPEEVLIYDERNLNYLCLDQSTAPIWKLCDGRSSASEIAAMLKVDERLVWYALKQLDKMNLLEGKVNLPASIANLPRREMVKLFGIAAVPVIASIVAPTAQAQVSIRCAGICNADIRCPPGCTCVPTIPGTTSGTCQQPA